MGGGDLNMKKSWHPLLQKNQEAVWKAETLAREERKRIEQKRKEIAEERQLLQLQRLQESQGSGKPRVERLDWMYTAPGAGVQTSEAMEQFLLGRRKVDELIMGDENEKVKKGAETGFIATQNANSISDTRNKILSDPLLAIKKQEQRQFEELMRNPVRLKKMREEIEGKQRSHRHRHRDEEGKRSRKRSRDDVDARREDKHSRPDGHKRSRDEVRRDDTRRNDRHNRFDKLSRDDDYRSEKRSSSQSPRRSKSRRHDSRSRDRLYASRPRDPPRYSSPPRRRSTSPSSSAAAREAALHAMQSNALELESSRAERLTLLEQKERTDAEREASERVRKGQIGGRAGFISDIQGRIMEEGRRAVVR
jgi:Pre-mRNA splicing factor/N-terminal domain of CBF1 interacting co-repressor CIR